MKAFGKLDLFSPLPLRGFEVYFKIKARKGATAWVSAYASVQNLLDHLGRFTRSESSREKYLRHLLQFSKWSNLRPEQLIEIPRRRAQLLIQGFADGLAAKERSKAYVNSVIKRLKTFFRVNGYTGSEELNVRTYYVPARYRKVPEYIPTKGQVHAMADAAGGLRDRSIILTLWSSGARVSTLCALNYGDVEIELKNGESHVLIPVYPEMKSRVADACKGQIAYYTFICPEAGQALRTYLIEREEKYGKIKAEDPLFHSDWTLWSRSERSGKRLGRRGVGLTVKRAAKLAGISKWKDITSHCLRKSFQSVLRAPTVDGGRMDKGTQEFLFGHILPGTQDPYYDRTKVNFHREEYSKLDFSREEIRARMVDKLITMSELESHLEAGWSFVARINDNSLIMRRSG